MDNDFLSLLEKELLEKKLITDKIDNDFMSTVDVVGFDIDHTLSIYNHETMADLLYNSFILFLVEHKNYPKTLLIYHEDQKESKFSVEQAYKLSYTEVIIDIEKGNVIRIDEEMKVFQGYHGTKELSEYELDEYYGKDRIFPEFDYESRKDHYLYITSFFEYHAIPIYLFCVQLYDEGMIPHIKNYTEIKTDLTQSFEFNFSLYDSNNLLKRIESSGYFFPEIYKDPKKYLHSYCARELLIFLKANNKKIFIASNSFYEYADHILQNTVGQDYLNYVDLVFVYSKKPGFFRSTDNQGFILDLNKSDHKGLNVYELNTEIYESLKENKVLIEGNFNLVNDFFQRALGRSGIQYIFIGDNFNSDCVHSGRLENWRSISIYELIETGRNGYLPKGYGEAWYRKDKRDYFYKVIREHTILTISNVESLKYLNYTVTP